MRDSLKGVLALLLVVALAALAWDRFGAEMLLGKPGEAVVPAEPNVKALEALSDVETLRVEGILGGTKGYDMGGRNLFQYGIIKPPPPTKEELEAMRRAEQARLEAMEEQARKQAEEQRKIQEENERRAREAAEAARRAAEQQKAQAAPQVPVQAPPPPINLKLVGYMGPAASRIAVFQNGNDIVLGRAGEVIEGKFKVLVINVDSVEMGYTDPAHKDSRKRLDLGT